MGRTAEMSGWTCGMEREGSKVSTVWWGGLEK